MSKDVAILIPHYKTLKMTKLCLDLLKKNTDLAKGELIVIDNGSNDESTDYLKSLDGITLITRDKIEGEKGATAHSNALDLALEKVSSPYFLSIHTDTFVIHPKWLDFLLAQIESEEKIAGVGSWKLEFKPWYKRALKKAEKVWQEKVWFPLRGKNVGDKENYYLRSHCALYRTEYVRKYTNGFNDGGETAGKVLHKKLIENGFSMRFLDSDSLSRYVRHLNHATVILNPELQGKSTGKAKQMKRVQKAISDIAGTLP